MPSIVRLVAPPRLVNCFFGRLTPLLVPVRHCRKKALGLVRILLLSPMLLAGCRQEPSALSVSQRFDELLRPKEERDGLSTAGCASIAMDSEIRPIIAEALTLAHANVQPTQAGPQSFRIPQLDGLAGLLPTVQAAVRRGDEAPQARDVHVVGSPEQRFVTVQFTESDVGQALDVAINGWGPPADVDAVTAPFVVPATARLRFGIAVRSAIPARAHYRVSVVRDGQTAVPLYVRDVSTMSATYTPTWEDVEAPLLSYEGQRVRLRFEAGVKTSLSAEGAPIAPPRAVIGTPAVVTTIRGMPIQGVILVSIDTLRADHVGTYGYRRPVSPTIDRLATQGTVFENVIAAWPETSASHMTLFTSLYPSVHRIGIMKWGGAMLPRGAITLSEVLREHGFVTAAFTEDGLLMASVGFTRGFDTYREFLPPVTGGPHVVQHPIDGAPVAGSSSGEAAKVFASGSAWLQRHQQDRFLLFLHTYQVHQRSAPGAPYDTLRQSFVGDGVTPAIATADNFLATYDAAIAYTDAALGGLVKTLDGLQLTGRTLLIVTSDHGEAFFEHGVFGHNQTLYDPELRVPLVWHAPGVLPTARRIRAQIGLIDLAPTLLDILGLPPLEHAQGRSAASLIAAGEGQESAPVICELGDQWRALRTNTLKLIERDKDNPASVELYDLSRDPGETAKLNIDGRAEGEAARKQLQEHEAECQSLRPQLVRHDVDQRVPAAELDEATRQRLRALGYNVPPPR